MLRRLHNLLPRLGTKPARSRLVAVLLAGCWAAAVVLGFAALEGYGTTPGPVGTTRPRDRGPGPSLLLFAHPRCPCTRASLTELAEIVARAPAGLTAEVVFVRPKGVPAGWERTPLWDAAAAIPGVRVRADDGGAEARRLGAKTSGHVLVYNAAGNLLFSGGITRSRGHEGESAGRRAVLAVLAGAPAPPAPTPVFGCSLVSPGDSDEEPEPCKD